MVKNSKKSDSVVADDPAVTEEVRDVTPVVDSVSSNAAPVADQQPVSGRAVFAVSRVDVGIAVHTAFLAEDGRLLQMPAVFPNLEYGLQQIDEMRQMVIQQFSSEPPLGN